MNPYEILGLRPDATAAQIKRAHRRLAKTAHPDVGGDRRAFERLQAAYDLLMDQERRAHFDATGEWQEQKPANGHGPALQLLAEVFHMAIERVGKAGKAPHQADLIVETDLGEVFRIDTEREVIRAN